MNWQKQSADKPLFEDLLWSRPQNKRASGKLLVVGGHAQEFAQVANAYQAAQTAGAGAIKVTLPQSLSKLAATIPDVQFAPANQIGSFAQGALAELLDAADWADAALLAGDFGKNSETTAMLDNFLAKTDKLAVIAEDCLQSIGTDLDELADMNIDLVIGFDKLQKLGSALKLDKPFVSTMPNEALADNLSELTKSHSANIVIVSESYLWVASQGRAISTKSAKPDTTKLAAACAVWHMQHPAKPLEALSTACYEISQDESS